MWPPSRRDWSTSDVQVFRYASIVISSRPGSEMFGRNKNKLKQHESILLIDDDKGQLDIFATWILTVRPNAVIQTATSVRQASELIKAHIFSLVISDYSMPHAGAGLEVFDAAVQSGLSGSSFIMLSGTTDNLPDSVRLVSKGDLATLESAIEQALR